jgi:hypothetical protein
VTASLVWWTADDLTPRATPAGCLPAGVLVDHGDHTMLVPWVPHGELPQFTLESLVPLTVAELVVCPTCARSGWITGGAWLPAREVSRG